MAKSVYSNFEMAEEKPSQATKTSRQTSILALHILVTVLVSTAMSVIVLKLGTNPEADLQVIRMQLSNQTLVIQKLKDLSQHFESQVEGNFEQFRDHVELRMKEVEQEANLMSLEGDHNLTQSLTLVKDFQDELHRISVQVQAEIREMNESRMSMQKRFQRMDNQSNDFTDQTEELKLRVDHLEHISEAWEMKVQTITATLNNTRTLALDLRGWRDNSFLDILKYHLEDYSLTLYANVTSEMDETIGREITLVGDSFATLLQRSLNNMVTQFNQDLVEIAEGHAINVTNKLRLDLNRDVVAMKVELVQALDNDPVIRELKQIHANFMARSREAERVYELTDNLVEKTFEEAREYCQNRGGDIPEFHFMDGEITFAMINEKARARGIERWWLGATDSNQEGKFKWLNNSPMLFTKWNIGEPNDIRNEDCIEVITSSGLWNDASCGLTKNVICSLPKS